MRRGTAFLQNERGVVAIEFAFLALPFFLIIFAILEVSLLLTASMQFESAVDRVSRRVMTGEVVNQENAIRSNLCAEVVLPIDCSKIRVDYREIASAASFNLPSPIENREIRSSAFAFTTIASPSFSSLRVGYEWPIAITPLQIFLANLNNQSHFIVSTALARVEK